MKVLFTGASSFTGHWFVKALADAGHDVVATFQGAEDDYSGVRNERIKSLSKICAPVFNCSFGATRFVQLVQSESRWDALCHHAADVTEYRSPKFDIAAALGANTHNLAAVLDAMAARNCQRLSLTGSVFEAGEGAGSEDLPAFSPYGVSKALTAAVAEYYAQAAGLHFGKFVIANPFGPFEEPRFTAYLVNTWARGQLAEVKTPDYVRDNIHVDLLAQVYAGFVGQLPATPGSTRLNPSGYIESQGRFAERFAAALRARNGFACDLQLNPQTHFDEPVVRINTDPAAALAPSWSESLAWDALADYYAPAFGAPRES